MEALFPLLIAGLGIVAIVAFLRTLAFFLRLLIVGVLVLTLWNVAQNKPLLKKASGWVHSQVATLKLTQRN